MPPRASLHRRALQALSLAFGVLALAASPSAAAAQGASTTDPRANLKGGWKDAGEAAKNLRVVSTSWKPASMTNTADLGDFGFLNSDLAFSGKFVFQGNFNGLQIWDASDIASPKLRTLLPCPGGQGDVSVHGTLMFMSVEETRGRVDCGGGGVKDTVSAERFRGVRIFDIADIDHPRLVTQVQTCRGSHTHTLVEDPKDKGVVYIYVQGTSTVRSSSELAGCSRLGPDEDPNTSLFRIEIIRVPLASPQDARVVNSPRIFADKAGKIAGLWKGGAHGDSTQTTSETNQCHDILVYPAIGLAAGACSGNGILLDISDPVNPKRLAEVIDPNFAYWHSANFSNDGSKVLYTDEWGGGTAPRCRVTDKMTWGADAIFTVKDRTMTLGGYYKLPVAQTAAENCVAHNGSIIPVPGRDIMAQGWYQGGVSVFDFTDPAHAQEIAYFDRGPVDSTKMLTGGSWAAYWHNGYLYSTEIARGLDILDLVPSDYLSANEIAAAKLVQHDVNNPQNQTKNVWPADPVVARAYLDQLVRYGGLVPARTTAIAAALDRAEAATGAAQKKVYGKLASELTADAKTAADAARVRAMAAVVRQLAK